MRCAPDGSGAFLPYSYRRQEGELYRDSLARVFVDVADTAENRQFFVRLKDRLKSRFQQKDIWLTTYPIEVI